MNRLRTTLTILSASFLAVAAFKIPPASAAGRQDPASPEFYAARVAPILQANCARCHGGLNRRGGFSIDTKESLLKGSKSGPVIVPGHPEQSLLVKLVHQADLTEDQRPMPPKGKLADAEILTLEQWIKAGAQIPVQR